MAELSDFIDDLDEQLADELESDEIVDAKIQLATDAQTYARSIAPEDTGEYKDLIQVHNGGGEVYLGFDDDASNIIEYGSEDTPEFAVRSRTEEHFNPGGRAQ